MLSQFLVLVQILEEIVLHIHCCDLQLHCQGFHSIMCKYALENILIFHLLTGNQGCANITFLSVESHGGSGRSKYGGDWVCIIRVWEGVESDLI